MSEPEKKKRVLQRSPNFPMIDLPDAIAKARRVYQAERRNAVSRPAILKDLGFKSETGHAARVVSALLQYGLLEKVGDNLRLSERGNSILNLSDGSADRRAAITEAAKRPNLFGELLGTYADGLPSDNGIRDHLVGAKQFNPTSVDQFIKVFRSTVDFANLRPDGDGGEADSPETEEGMDTQVDDTGDAKGKAKPLIPPAQGEKELLRFNLSGDRTVRLIFGGPHPTQEEIDELADYLKVSRRTFPAKPASDTAQ